MSAELENIIYSRIIKGEYQQFPSYVDSLGSVINNVTTVFQDYRLNDTFARDVYTYLLAKNPNVTLFALLPNDVNQIAKFAAELQKVNYRVISNHAFSEINPRANNISTIGPKENGFLVFR